MKRRFRVLAAFLATIMLFSAITVMPAFAAAADLEDGANYMIVSKKNGKALTVADNSAEEGAGIVQMPAGSYGSQVWTLKQTSDKKWQLINAFSGMAMSIPDGSTDQGVQAAQTAEIGDNCEWIITDTDDGYCWIAPVLADTLCLNISRNRDDDGQAIIQWIWEDSDNEKWSFVKVEQIKDNPTPYPDAVTAADAYLANFVYEENGKAYFENCSGNHFWQCVESIEVVLDAYQRTGDVKYLTAAEKLYAGFIGGNKTGARGTDWSGNDYNDDIMWGVIASTRLYMMTNNSYYLEVGKSNFDMCYERAWDTTFLGGGLWWRTENESKNACVEGPGAIAACLLGDATGDTSYYDKAKAVIDWTIKNLYQDDGGLWDSVYTNRDPNKWISSYNQGTFIGACTMLSKHFSDVDYLSYAKKAAERATRLNLNGEQNSGDLIGFKGILARWLGYYCVESGDDSFVGFMQEWAQTIWDNRNSGNLMWTTFENETPDDIKNQTISGVKVGDWGYWGCSPAVSWVVNTPGTVDADHKLNGVAAAETVSVSVDETAQIGVTLDPADTLAKGLVWRVADDSVVQIDSHTADGAVIRGLKEGTTTITVSSVQNSAVKTAISVTVTPSKYTHVVLEAEDGILSDGATISNNNNASGGKHVGNLGEGNDDSVAFTVSSPADVKATVNLYYATAQDRWYGIVVNGGAEQTVQGTSTGGWMDVSRVPLSVEIQLKAGDNTIVVSGNNVDPAPNLDYIEVIYPVTPDGVTLNQNEAELTVGEELTLNAEVFPDNVLDKGVVWTSSNEAVATVENGAVIAVGAGEAMITVTTVTGKFSAECLVTVRSDHTHELIHVEAVEPGCHSNGNIEYWHCEDCGGFWQDEALTQVTDSQNVILPATGGEVTHVEAVEPGCHRDGNIEYWYCKECEGFWQDEALTQTTNSQNVILPALSCLAKAYDDVNLNAWYHPAIDFVLGEGMMQGTSETIFAPDADLTRAQLVQILYNYEGEPEHSGKNNFEDVAQNAWFYDAITWAAEHEIVKGMDESHYDPDAKITREQMVTILWRYVGMPEAASNKLSFPDAAKIADYAVPAVAWAVENEVVKGMEDGSFAPQATSSRAQMAQIMLNYYG